ncbi:MAG: RNA 2'-phosphotransferase [Pirellulaceae bacterium]
MLHRASIFNADYQTEDALLEILYHGTVAAFLDSIRATGLQKRSRHHVHLSPDEETATKVGFNFTITVEDVAAAIK